MWSVLFFPVSSFYLFWSPFYVALWLSHPALFPVDSDGLAAIPLTTCLCFVYCIAFVCPLFRNCYSNYNSTIGQMDKFVTKSPVSSDEKSLNSVGLCTGYTTGEKSSYKSNVSSQGERCYFKGCGQKTDHRIWYLSYQQYYRRISSANNWINQSISIYLNIFS